MNVDNYVLMRDDKVKSMFTNPRTGKKFSASVIAHILGIDEKEIYNNLEYIYTQIGVNSNIVDSETDTFYQMDKILINIEFNKSNKGKITKVKNEAYICGLYLRQLPNSKVYKALKPIIQINIDAYDYFKKNKFLYHSMLMETSLHLVESKNIEIYHINLLYLRKKDYNKVKTDEDRLEELLYILVCDNKLVLDKLYEGDELMSEVRKELERKIEAIDAFLYYNKEELDQLDLEVAREDAMKEGLEEGVEQGIAQRNVEIAKNMVNENISDELISKTTGLSVEEINKLKQEN